MLCSFRLTPPGVAFALFLVRISAVLNGFNQLCWFWVYIQKRIHIAFVWPSFPHVTREQIARLLRVPAWKRVSTAN
jgi:hypothetical protein